MREVLRVFRAVPCESVPCIYVDVGWSDGRTDVPAINKGFRICDDSDISDVNIKKKSQLFLV